MHVRKSSLLTFELIILVMTGTLVVNPIICKLYIFPVMCADDKVWITELTLIHKNIRSVHNSHSQAYQSIWRKTHNDLTDKNKNISSEGLHRHIVRNIWVFPARPIELTGLLAMMSVSTFKFAVILYLPYDHNHNGL